MTRIGGMASLVPGPKLRIEFDIIDHKRHTTKGPRHFETMASTLLRRQLFNGLRPFTRSLECRACVRNFSFTFAGPRKLDDLIKKDLVQDKTGSEVADLWFTYHEEKVRSHRH